MRDCLPGVLSPEEAAALAGDVNYRDFDEPVIAGLVSLLRDRVSIDTSSPSYVRVEDRPAGCPWHFDAGRHMAWCSWSAGILLTPPSGFSGGALHFRDVEPGIFHYCDMWFWSGDEERRSPCVVDVFSGRW